MHRTKSACSSHSINNSPTHMPEVCVISRILYMLWCIYQFWIWVHSLSTSKFFNKFLSLSSLIILWCATLKLYLYHILNPSEAFPMNGTNSPKVCKQSLKLWQQVIFPRKPLTSPAMSSDNKKRILMLSQPLVFPCTALKAFDFPADTVRCWRTM